MATSTFCRHFTVAPDKVDEFISELTGPTTPALPKGFKTGFVRPDQNEEFWRNLYRALSENQSARASDTDA